MSLSDSRIGARGSSCVLVICRPVPHLVEHALRNAVDGVGNVAELPEGLPNNTALLLSFRFVFRAIGPAAFRPTGLCVVVVVMVMRALLVHLRLLLLWLYALYHLLLS